jgi:hypothetical protein
VGERPDDANTAASSDTPHYGDDAPAGNNDDGGVANVASVGK